MRIFRSAIAAVLMLASPLWAGEPENTLMIEVAGEASGVVEILLRPDVAPSHVQRIKQLARAGKYDDVVFHRVIGGFMAQTGDVEHGRRDGFNMRYAGMGGSEFPDLKAEFSKLIYEEGIVGMARSSDPDSANSQFFIMFDAAPSLNGQYTVVGKVVSGQQVVNAIKKGSRSANGAVQDPDYMKKVWIKSDQ